MYSVLVFFDCNPEEPISLIILNDDAIHLLRVMVSEQPRQNNLNWLNESNLPNASFANGSVC